MSKLLLAGALGGIVLGTALSQHVSPKMNAAPDADWRDRYRAAYSDTSMQFVDIGPTDLAPVAPWPEARLLSAQDSSYGSYDRYDPYYQDDYGEPGTGLEAGDIRFDGVDSDVAVAADQIEETADRAAKIAEKIKPATVTILRVNRMISPGSLDAPPAPTEEAL